jgi:MinD-like ATPase involved in chromosome partitioning or flagellar assembly
VFRCVDRVELLAAIRGAAPDLVVVAGCPPWLDRQACDEAVAARIPMVGLAREGDAEALARLGILVLPLDAAVERVLAVRSSEEALPLAPAQLARSLGPRGRATAVWGPKGSPGRSTIALEVAAELAAADPRTVLVDADTYGGDLAQMLGVVEELPTIVWASQAAARGDDGSRPVERLRRAGARGPVLVPGVTRSDLWRDVREHAWRQLVASLREEFAHVVVDTGFCIEEDVHGDGRNAIARAAIRDADSVVALCRCDAVGLKTFLWAYRALAELADEDQVFVVANRVAAGEEAQVAGLLRRHTGKRPIAYVPDAPAIFRAALGKGAAVRDVAPSSPVVRAIEEVAAALGGKPRPAGVFARLAGRS